MRLRVERGAIAAAAYYEIKVPIFSWRQTMNRGTVTFLALVIGGTVSQVAFSQGDGADNQVHPFAFLESLSMVIMPDGHSARRQISDEAMSDMIMKNAKPMRGGMIFFMHGGKIFMTKDEATAAGPMLASVILHPKQ